MKKTNDNADLLGDSPEKGEVRVGKLDSLKDVRRELGRLYREARRTAGHDVDAQTASKLAFILNTIARSLESTELEKRIRELEDYLRKKS